MELLFDFNHSETGLFKETGLARLSENQLPFRIIFDATCFIGRAI